MQDRYIYIGITKTMVHCQLSQFLIWQKLLRYVFISLQKVWIACDVKIHVHCTIITQVAPFTISNLTRISNIWNIHVQVSMYVIVNITQINPQLIYICTVLPKLVYRSIRLDIRNLWYTIQNHWINDSVCEFNQLRNRLGKNQLFNFYIESFSTSTNNDLIRKNENV